mmetsp:Transcript_116692/g.164016  ORF Transcript_116692/g.164016 Transcript_116692/m.164016 type:complete len:255 (+) Transcript_116692:95-859(+)
MHGRIKCYRPEVWSGKTESRRGFRDRLHAGATLPLGSAETNGRAHGGDARLHASGHEVVVARKCAEDGHHRRFHGRDLSVSNAAALASGVEVELDLSVGLSAVGNHSDRTGDVHVDGAITAARVGCEDGNTVNLDVEALLNHTAARVGGLVGDRVGAGQQCVATERAADVADRALAVVEARGCAVRDHLVRARAKVVGQVIGHDQGGVLVVNRRDLLGAHGGVASGRVGGCVRDSDSLRARGREGRERGQGVLG